VPVRVTGAGRSLVDPRRLRRAVHLTVEGNGPVYLVTGGSVPRTVDLDSVTPCVCEDALMRGARCKHELAALLHRGEPQVIRALRLVVPVGRGLSVAA